MVGVIDRQEQSANFSQDRNKANEENPMQRFISSMAMVVVVYAWIGMGALGGWQPAFGYAAPPLCQDIQEAAPPFLGERFARTELCFGSEKPDGSEVTDEEFTGFLNEVITPRFPDGLTLLAGRGQFLNAQGKLVQERSWLLILLYPAAAHQDSSKKIEEIRQAYKQCFQQESVLRVDRCCERVGF
jgi:hypothetical protein